MGRDSCWVQVDILLLDSTSLTYPSVSIHGPFAFLALWNDLTRLSQIIRYEWQEKTGGTLLGGSQDVSSRQLN